ncbi:hypothetical protein RA266_29000, partial [Pseudomonas syringae pv. tagetis]|uniref:hypothetical protein n=1 Tax=Pseudomonas syringae group genomosp. 7 TaxID=251699 RepID=UPI00376F6FCE
VPPGAATGVSGGYGTRAGGTATAFEGAGLGGLFWVGFWQGGVAWLHGRAWVCGLCLYFRFSFYWWGCLLVYFAG